MGKMFVQIILAVAIIFKVEAFYKPNYPSKMETCTPQSLDEVKNCLCGNTDGQGNCADDKPTIVIINKEFDFTDSDGVEKEVGCIHPTWSKSCTSEGQLKLNVNNHCNGLTPTDVTYNKAGRMGIKVGSNKIIIGQNKGGFKGKGLRLENSKNVEIRNLRITDINPQVIWGGDAIDLIGVTNVLIDNNYIKDIGRMMIISHFRSSKDVTISNNVFDGETRYAAYCNGKHYWLWEFGGKGDQITVQNNIIKKTSGRGPYIKAADNSKSIIHIVWNEFHDVDQAGLITLDDTRSSVLVEGNLFENVEKIVSENKGNIFIPQNKGQETRCEGPLGRKCFPNTVINSNGLNAENADQVMKDFEELRKQRKKFSSGKKGENDDSSSQST